MEGRVPVKRLLAALIPLALLVGACSGDEAPAATGTGTSGGAGEASSSPGAQSATAQPTTANGQASSGSAPGHITLTIGDETWEFEGALCAFENAAPGEDGSEWNVSFTQGNNQVYVSEDSFGPRVSIADVVNFGSFEWAAEGDAVTIEVDGKDISAEGTFTDLTGVQRDGKLTATCSSWFEA